MRKPRLPEYQGPRLPPEVQLRRLKNVIENEMTPIQRETLTAYYFEEKSMGQIARERGVNISTVSRNIRRAEEKLSKYLRY